MISAFDKVLPGESQPQMLIARNQPGIDSTIGTDSQSALGTSSKSPLGNVTRPVTTAHANADSSTLPKTASNSSMARVVRFTAATIGPRRAEFQAFPAVPADNYAMTSSPPCCFSSSMASFSAMIAHSTCLSSGWRVVMCCNQRPGRVMIANSDDACLAAKRMIS